MQERSRDANVSWFRGKDLGLTDHEPLNYALQRGEVLPLFVLDPFFDARFTHKPWTAPDGLLRESGFVLGVNYPRNNRRSRLCA